MVGPIRNNNDEVYVKKFAEKTFNKREEEISKPIDFSDRGDYKTDRKYDESKRGYETMRYPSDDGGEIINGKEEEKPKAQTCLYPSDDGGEIINDKDPEVQTCRYPSDDGGEINLIQDLPEGWKQSANGIITTEDGKTVVPVNVQDLPENSQIQDGKIFDSEGNEIGRAVTSEFDTDGDGTPDEVTSYYLYVNSEESDFGKPDFEFKTMRYPSDDGGEIRDGKFEKPEFEFKTMRYPSDDGGEIWDGKFEKPEFEFKTMRYPSDDGGEIIDGGKFEKPYFEVKTLLYPSDDGGEIFNRKYHK